MIKIDLQGKTALVTGGTSGIGYQIVKTFVQSGANVIFVGTSEDKANQLIEECSDLKKAEQKIEFLKLDVSDFNSVQDGISKTYLKFENIDILVNCAGITKDKLILKMIYYFYIIWDNIKVKGAIQLKNCLVIIILRII